ncbi:MAG: hypothetical protein LC795_15630 [Acidobacteria bacterium]|nr:hypothetical protein [Acidobacteriota bacterium]MCA1620706.1 hypothetical protein [Acidobacteriota bacterium]
MYLLLRGNVDIADRLPTGEPGALQELGETPDFEITIDEERAENMATGGAFNEKDLSVTTYVGAKGTMRVKEVEGNNLPLALFGEETADAGGAVVAQAFPAGIAVGEKHFLPGRPLGVSAVTIVDSAGAPDTLEAGTDYELDADFGTVKFLNVDGFTQPFKASYTEAASAGVTLATKVTGEKFVYFRGINIADEEKPVVGEFYRTRFSPSKKVTLKTADGKEVTVFEFELEFLADKTKTAAPPLGRLGRLRYQPSA